MLREGRQRLPQFVADQRRGLRGGVCQLRPAVRLVDGIAPLPFRNGCSRPVPVAEFISALTAAQTSGERNSRSV